MHSLFSWLLVGVQIALLGYLLSSASWRAIRIDLQIWELSGAFLAISGVLGLSWHSFSIFIEPKSKGKLVRTGIFAFIRHPVYAGILMVCAALVWQFWTLPRIFAWLALLLIFIIKIRKEEAFLSKKFPEYLDYKINTNRLIPFVW